MSVQKNDWVRIHNIVLSTNERAPQVPEDTKSVPLEIWAKGFLQDSQAELGDTVKIKTLTGRIVEGCLVEDHPTYTHSFGQCVPELLKIGIQLREILSGGESDDE